MSLQLQSIILFLFLNQKFFLLKGISNVINKAFISRIFILVRILFLPTNLVIIQIKIKNFCNYFHIEGYFLKVMLIFAANYKVLAYDK